MKAPTFTELMGAFLRRSTAYMTAVLANGGTVPPPGWTMDGTPVDGWDAWEARVAAERRRPAWNREPIMRVRPERGVPYIVHHLDPRPDHRGEAVRRDRCYLLATLVDPYGWQILDAITGETLVLWPAGTGPIFTPAQEART